MGNIQIPGLELQEKLGEGGMASVWKARQLSLDRIVAVKLLPADAGGDDSDVKRFQAEAKSAAKLKHPGIVQVYDVNLEQGVHYIVMEYIAGYTVRDWLRRKGKLSENEALQVADCVADALEYAWTKERIIHCDIKPDNVMVDADGTVKVADLGLARSARAVVGGVDESHILGTPAYMSPEQVMGVSDLDCRSDIYSLGAMIYELLTGKYPFHGNPEEKILEMQVRDTIEDPITAAPKMTKGTFWLIEKMLAKDRSKRHQDWSEVRVDIAKVRKGKLFGPLMADGESTVRRSRMRLVQPQAAASKVLPASGRGERSVLPLVIGIAAAIALVALAVVFINRAHKSVTDAETVTVSEVNQLEAGAQKLFDEAVTWAANNPGRYDDAIERFRAVRARVGGTRYSARVDAEITRLSNSRESAIQVILERLKDETSPLTDARKYGEAAAVYESYDGELAAESRSIRLSIAEQLREDQRQVASRPPSQEPQENRPPSSQPQGPGEDVTKAKVIRLLDALADRLLSDGIEVAQAEFTAGMMSGDVASRTADLQPLKDLLDGACAVNARIIDSFGSQRGRQITVSLNGGPIDFVVSDVRDGRVSGVYKRRAGSGVADVPMSFGIKELAPSEKVQRMGLGDSPEIALAKGLLAYTSKAYPLAKNYFSKTHRFISGRLIARLPQP